MQTSRFQLGLIATLAIGLGFSLASSQAVGYPAGAVSFGSNPIQSFGGTVTAGETVTFMTLPPDQDFVVTDIALLSRNSDADCIDRIDARVKSGSTTVGSYMVSSSYHRGTSERNHAETLVWTLASGMKVSAGEVFALETELASSFTYYGCHSERTTKLEYTVSGYYSQS